MPAAKFPHRLLVSALCCVLGLQIAVASAAERASGAAPTAERRTGTKLATDPMLRQGMAAIAALLGNQWSAIKAAQLQPSAYLDLADKVAAQLADTVKTGRLDPAAGKTFHDIQFDMNRALELMRSPKIGLQRAGALALAQALRNYGTYFDHPGWALPD